MSRRSAPRQQVLEVWRTGSGYGTVWWHHRLACGHVEVRKRRAPAEQVGCLRCEAGAQVATVAAPDTYDRAASLDTDAAVLRARLASALGLPIEGITVQLIGDRVAGAMIFLDPAQVADVLQR